jgi:3-hydroxybutyryl-CoA dehydrogenase
VRLYGDDALTAELAKRLTNIPFEHLDTHADSRIADTSDFVLYRTDGRLATARAADNGVANTILVDLVLDVTKATRLAICAADQAELSAFASAAGLLQAAGYAVSPMADVPGMIVFRTVAMLANEAADVVNQGVCSAADCDLAMRKGVNYPLGPLGWTDRIGADVVVEVLDNLAQTYGEDRYRTSPLLRRKAIANSHFHEAQGKA